MPWGYAAAAVGTVVAGSMQADAAKSAADSQAASAKDALELTKAQYQDTQNNINPYLQNGTAANNKLAYMLGLSTSPTKYAGQNGETQDNFNEAAYLAANPDVADKSKWGQSAWDHYQMYGKNEGRAFQYLNDPSADQAAAEADPVYGSLLKKFDANDLANDVVYNSGLKFGLDQGTNAINQRALQSGNYDSGATLKALTQYANDYGSTKANEAYTRYNQDQNSIYSKLTGASNTGLSAAGTLAGTGANSANAQSNLITGAGSAESAGTIGAANAAGSAVSGLNSLNNSYNSNELLKKLLAQNSSNSSMYGNRGTFTTSDFSNASGY